MTVSVDASHALFESVWVPWDIVVKQDVATLQVDPFSGSFSGDENLNVAFAELLFGMESASGFISRTWFHPAMDAADTESPVL